MKRTHTVSRKTQETDITLEGRVFISNMKKNKTPFLLRLVQWGFLQVSYDL